MTTRAATTDEFDRPAASLTTSGKRRFAGIDVARAVALIGVVAMNYAGSLVVPGTDRGFWGRVFDPYTGVLSTRFAATFVVVAGIGISLLTERARVDGDPQEVTRSRLRLARRGLLLYGVGYFLDFTWPGTILFYYGAYFMIAALLVRVATRWLVVIGASAGIVASAIATWSMWRWDRGEPLMWLNVVEVDSLQDLASRTFLSYTHPVLPWIAFLCAGMIIGRHLDTLSSWRRPVIAVSAGVIVAVYALVSILDRTSSRDGLIVKRLTSIQTYDRGLLYLVSTLAIAVLAVLVIVWLAENFATNSLVVAFQRAGQLSLSLYLLHVLVFSMFVNWFGWIGGGSLSTALTFAGAFWVAGIAIASWWHHRIGRGPAEAVYRIFGG